MRVLLDTHVFVWALADTARLGPREWEILRDPETSLLLSVASAWELAIKSAAGKISLPGGVRPFVADGCRLTRITLLPVELSHVEEVSILPLHHRDPFDRMIVAQARVERLLLMSRDTAFDSYEVGRAQ